ncbi:DUF4238 domain-containing protein [Sapientia aquatica]|uniref:DUF4238 domain-containing protein n=1 Tax=Sapientia aquatica TaxID=1549640 RepID=A0A4R5W6F6_9BURK|nr:DUF4238 domain-containing protein [Sapientia aquatica]TDK67984.1 DUF4238 domain-containing protein [Sapientia aquatica]
MATHNPSKNHHWIPQCYLKGFAKSRSKKASLYVVDAIAKKAFDSIPRYVGSAKDFNRIEVPGFAPDHIESQMSKFETQLDQALGRVIQAKSLDNLEDFNLILNLIALMAVRTPRKRETIRQSQEQILKRVMEMSLSNRAQYESTIENAKKSGEIASDSNVSYESIREFIERDKYKIEIPTARHIVIEFDLQDTILPLLGKRKWILLKAPAKSGFITTDHPVVLRWKEQKARGFFASPGHATMGTELFFPISQELAMVGTFEGPQKTIDINEDYVAYFNGVLIHSSQRQVYARDGRFKYVAPDGVIRFGADLLKDVERFRPNDKI